MIGWAVLAALAVFAGLRVFAGYPLRASPFARLRRAEAAFLEATAEVMFPEGGAIPRSGLDAGIPGYTDRYLDASPPRMRLLMRLLFFLIEHATILLPAGGSRGWRRFSSLSPEQRVAVLEGWRTSRFFPRRLVFTSLRAILTMGYFGDPEVLRTLRLAPYAIDSPILEADILYPRIGSSRSEYSAGDQTPPSTGIPLDLDGPLHPTFAEKTA